MLNWPLHYPDDPKWREQLRYSSRVAKALVEAYLCLKRGLKTPAAYRQAHAIVYPISTVRMSVRQRLHVVYILAMGHIACEEYMLACGCLDEALELALRLEDEKARLELLYLRGTVYRYILLLREAASDLTECLILLDQVSDGDPAPKDRDFALDALVQLANVEFFLASYDMSVIHLDQARRLIAQTSDNEQTEASILWISALHERLRGRSESALTHAINACSIYAKYDAPAPFGRIQVLAANIALDICERTPIGWAFDQYFRLAADHTEGGSTAILRVLGAPDHSGQGLALLTHARAARLSGAEGNRDIDRRGIIEDVIQMAIHIDDSALLCQAYVGLGAELSVCGEHEASHNLYRQAISISDEHGIQSLAVPARRALLHRNEMMGTHD